MIANCIDVEHDDYAIIEVGLVVINLKSREITKKYSIPVIQETISPKVSELTGWTVEKLQKQGCSLDELKRRLFELYACHSRLLIIDHPYEFIVFPDNWNFNQDRMNVSTLFKIKTGIWKNLSLEDMLLKMGLKFEGTPHRALDDAFNIGRLFLKLI